jgi:anti-sigma factor RsiW
MSERPPIPDDPIAAALRTAFAGERAPHSLEKRLAQSLRALPTLDRRAARWRGPAIATTVVAVMISVGILFWRPHTADLADVPLKELQAFIDSGRAVDIATDDPASVRAWVAERVDFAPPLVARGDAEIKLIGGRLCLFSGRRVASYMYRVHGRLVSIYIMTADGLKPTGSSRLEHAGRTLTLTREGHLSQASWTENGLIYSVVGDELSELALLSTLDELSR